MDVFSGENTPIKEWTDAIDRLVEGVGFPSTDKRLASQIELGERTNLILYKALLSHELLDPTSLLKTHPEIRQCFTILNQLSDTAHLFYQTPVKESLWKALSPETQLEFALTSKWGRQIRDDLQETLTFTEKTLPQPKVAETVGKRFQSATRLTFQDIDFTNPDNVESFRILVQDKTTSLTIHSCKGLLGLIALFPQFKKLQTLYLVGYDIETDGIKALNGILPASLKNINLSGTYIGADGIQALAEKIFSALKTFEWQLMDMPTDGILAPILLTQR